MRVHGHGGPGGGSAGVWLSLLLQDQRVTKPIHRQLQGAMPSENSPRLHAQLLLTVPRLFRLETQARVHAMNAGAGVVGWVASQRWIQSLSGKD